MSRPTFVVDSGLVRIDIKGVPHSGGRYYASDDQGIVKDLLDKMIRGELPKDAYMVSCGAGRLVSYWREKDAPAIIQFLESRADKVSDHPPASE